MLNLTGVFADEGFLSFQFTLDLSDLDFYGNHPFASPVQVSGQVENRAGIVTLQATAAFTFTAPCDRCGVMSSKSFKLPFEHILVTNTADEQDDFVIVEDMQLDEQALIRDDLVLWVPLKFLCRDDCKGLCQQCGQNWNEGPCSCESDTTDPRLAALKSLLSQD